MVFFRSVRAGALAFVMCSVPAMAHAETLRAHSRKLIEDTLAAHGGNVSQAARQLNVSRGTLYRRHEFSGDPHPGNFLLQDDGRVAFFDFGLFKRMDGPSVEFELACQREDFRPKPSRLCDFCAYKAYCPAWGGDPSLVHPVELATSA